MRRFWTAAWRFYDSPWGAFLPHWIAPWLLGRAFGSRGRRVGP